MPMTAPEVAELATKSALPRQGSPEADEAALEERKGMAMGGVPEPYLDAWARLQVQKPFGVSDAGWRQAMKNPQKAKIPDARRRALARNQFKIRACFSLSIDHELKRLRKLCPNKI